MNYINRIPTRLGLYAAIVALLACVSPASAQYLRTSYFMDVAQYRLQLNPAMAPSKGFIHLPGIGHANAAVRSNSLGLGDVFDIIKNADAADYYASDRFMNNLKDVNHALINAGTDLFAVGWWQGEKTFWSIGWSVRADGELTVRPGLFSFLRDMKGMETNDYSNYESDWGKQELNVNAYSEIALGYTRCFSDRFNAGVRVKALLGLGNANLKINRAVVKTNLQGIDPDINWSTAGPEEYKDARGTASVEMDATLESSLEGLTYETSRRGYIDDLKYETEHMGISGFGAGFDIGVSGRVTDELTLSAALVDMGFIKWSRGCTQVAHADADDLTFDSDKPGDMTRFRDVVSNGRTLNLDLLRLRIDEEAVTTRTTHLSPSMVLGADYTLMEEKLRLGMLYTNYFAHIRNESELTLSVNYTPNNLIGLTASYSPLLCGGQSFGLAFKVGPLFLGTDYMYLGKNTKCCNALVGLSIPLFSRPEQ